MKQLVIHKKFPDLTLVALLENGRLVEFFIERPDFHNRVGTIYKGRIVNVLSGMDAAFVDIGLEKKAFIHVDDLLPVHAAYDATTKPLIASIVTVGDELIVQMLKEPTRSKGAKVTAHFSLTGRWLVFMPGAGYVAISNKIRLVAERRRLSHLAERVRAPHEGIIVRTAADGVSDEAFERELLTMRSRWEQIVTEGQREKAPKQLFRDDALLPRMFRDLVTEKIDEIIVDNQHMYGVAREMLTSLTTPLRTHLQLHDTNTSILEAYPIREQMERANESKLRLPSGGYIVIDFTEALTVIDVNTGQFTGSSSLTETILKTNREAAEEVAHILRLRDIGGIIIIDFIDMLFEENRHEIEELLRSAVLKDRMKVHILGWTKLGLLEMTRKRASEHQDSLFFETCKCCGGRRKTKWDTLL